VASSGDWARAADFDGSLDIVRGTLVVSTNTPGSLYYRVTSADPITIGTDAITFEQVSGSLTQATVGAALYPRTAAEIAAGVTPTDYSYAPGHVLRYGENTTPGTTNMATAFQAAISSHPGEVFVPAGTYLIGSQLVCPDDTRIVGAGHTRTIITKGFSGDLFSFGYYFSMADLNINGAKATRTGGCFVQTNSVQRGFQLERVQIEDFAGHVVVAGSLAAITWTDVRVEDCDDYVWSATTGSDSDGTRYAEFKTGEVRACKGWLHVEVGGVFRVSEIQMRVQLCTEHAYRIDGTMQNCSIAGQISNNDGSAIYIGTADGRIITGQLSAGISSNCQDPPVADYAGDIGQIHQEISSNSGAYSMISMYGGNVTNSPTGIKSMKSVGNKVIMHIYGGQISGEWVGGYVLNMTQYQSSGADLSTTADYATFNVRVSGDELPYFEDGIGSRGYIGNRVQALNNAGSPYTLDRYTQNVVIDCTDGPVAITMPDAATCKGQRFYFVKIDASVNAATITRAGSDKINGANDFTLAAQWDAADLFASNNANWYRVV
jgi:hypothetical protein